MSLILGKHFGPAEFACHDAARTPYPEEWPDRWERLVLRLCDPIREAWGGVIEVVSGYRTPEYNANLAKAGHNVASQSHHMEGNAADLKPRFMAAGADDVLALHDLVLRTFEAGGLPELGGLGLYPDWIHVDDVKASDGHLRRWSTR